MKISISLLLACCATAALSCGGESHESVEGGAGTMSHSGGASGIGGGGAPHAGGTANGSAGTSGGVSQAGGGSAGGSGASSGARGGEGPGEPTSGPKLLSTLNPFDRGGARNLRASNGELFWKDSETLWRVNPETGERTPFYTPECNQPLGGFDLDDEEVFVATCSSISALSRSSEAARTVVSEHWLDLAKVGDELYTVGCRSDVKRMVAAPGPSNPQVVDSLGFDTNSCYTGIIAGGTRIYLSDGVESYDVTTGETLVLARGHVLDADETNAVVVVQAAAGDDVAALSLLDAQGVETPLYVPETPGYFGGGALIDGTVYYTRNSPPGDAIDAEVGVVTPDGAARSLVRAENRLASITADAGAIYWEEWRWDEAEVLTMMLWRLDR